MFRGCGKSIIASAMPLVNFSEQLFIVSLGDSEQLYCTLQQLFSQALTIFLTDTFLQRLLPLR